MNKIIITIVIIIIVIFGGYFIFRGADQPTPSAPPIINQPEAAVPVVEEKIITYTDSGFSPATLTIKKGETVVFKNQSAQSMWPASAFHPTHTAYPTTGGCLGSTLDACKGVQLGESWSFQFDFVGNWKYHDHLNPSNFGTIVVE
ncbi:MAG: hypothetical protein A2921_00520 [Candidatus Magasanikbacteria bacterium RIFCSPLOWO2_01_FULL_43_20b]|uniref:EfeO-type cupredoxin-like domain-containing protein n=1 Tax=Candidatus Magasanikbacteria bacterium RIFCSPLOWO2_12_FULL_43_12 TaxID=1798692 RepID=A0A1F6MVN6_9BACT|nr:MAG: hypothetical protein A3C74_04045 [Candidatus Magasanikbacteria bacterium RIFCSPHIGHO2_02_FULL_44_13]OGH72348.1 MAG: hypothetical protein A3I93_04120 [Candidatus Magasanikbacteria bacterium RIFCSPLOWO2_02_FULL_43_22]OGH72897.1 MAG: hypothetical protein A2921_00520 [Candidatus Magasanikbacteria bacterium RIFCSPLOWO2_01_FULL_43_20b]OGH75671.1 MAG: hypothetical protein A3G00_04230 [Candidatus Magasanikbacteria bacterium RIFCSPLOWO2_12_FULL_43_12]